MLRRWCCLAALAAAVSAMLAAGPAQAADVLVVDGDHVRVRHDPFAPTRAERYLPRPPRSGRVVGRSAVAGPSARRAQSTKSGRQALLRALRQGVSSGRIQRTAYSSYSRTYSRARSLFRRLRGARRTQLGYVITSLERMALRRQVVPARMPVLFLTLQRNVQYWRSLRFPRSGDQLSFTGSEILFQYYAGRGLQIQPLSTFKKANVMFGACNGTAPGGCRREGLARLLDEMNRLAVRRGRSFIAWEYLFDFGGGAPPWMSGMAQATGIQALGRASRLLGRPDYLSTARSALGAFERPPPLGVRTRGPGGGVHYLQYSFAPRLFIFNAFLQSIIGLYDYDQIAHDPRAAGLYRSAEPEGRREIPLSDVGDWSRYSHRGRESTHEYHELLRELLQSLCNRLKTAPYCTYARRYRDYQSAPAEVSFAGPDSATAGRTVSVSFDLSKLSAVQVTIVKDGRVAFDRVRTFRRGRGAFSWRPKSAGTYDVRIGAKEQRTGRGLKSRDTGTIEVG